MWIYEKKLEFPVNIKKKDLRMANYILTQYGGPDGELAAALRYLTQRYTMPTDKAKALLTDIGTEELAHVEMISTMVYQLIQDATPDEMAKAGLGDYYAVRGEAVYPADPAGNPFTAAYFQAVGDPIADLHEDMAAEQKARAAYERLINLTDDIDVIEPLRFLHQREVIHFQRFGEALDDVQFYCDHRKVF
ncbi:spore coat protein JC [Natranaerovirga pectinivora]|uniref:Spore coat protein JC n=1 Tax=Natranaerovirga pectinivora TaxID=682400 RepID=A0A4R3MMT1_9FIRM|nr:manganese catalase family protein [Natranaerovirga pectinivora]TCT16289.1 spore coat protein JC [Natranaerovirga pectinivora]